MGTVTLQECNFIFLRITLRTLYMKDQTAPVPDHYQSTVSQRCQDTVNVKEYIQ